MSCYYEEIAQDHEPHITKHPIVSNIKTLHFTIIYVADSSFKQSMIFVLWDNIKEYTENLGSLLFICFCLLFLSLSLCVCCTYSYGRSTVFNMTIGYQSVMWPASSFFYTIQCIAAGTKIEYCNERTKTKVRKANSINNNVIIEFIQFTALLLALKMNPTSTRNYKREKNKGNISHNRMQWIP